MPAERKRHAHYLKRNERCETPATCVFFDTETDGWEQGSAPVHEHRLTFGWANHTYHEKGVWRPGAWHRFELADEFWEWLTARARRKVVTYCFAHNLGYDFQVLGGLWELPARGWKLDWCILDDPPTLLQYSKGGAKLKFICTLNYWKASLDSIGETVGLPKLKAPGLGDPCEAWDTYCRRDVEVLRTAVLAHIEQLKSDDLGGFAISAASQAMRTYRHRFMKHQLLVHNQPDALQLGREAYVGGRNEAFRLGPLQAPVYVLDVNSLYPSVMRSRQYPVHLIGVDKHPTLATLARVSARYACIARVSLQCEVAHYPRLIEGRLCFPIGQFEATLAGPELALALRAGHVLDCHTYAAYECADIFTEYVDDMYQRRLDAAAQGHGAAASFYKLLLNSLYGKFGQRGGKWENFAESTDFLLRSWDDWDIQDKTLRKYRQIGHKVQRQELEGESRESIPAIAAYVTSYARVELLQMILEAGVENVHYVDTDSLFVTQLGYDRLNHRIDPQRLGCLKLVGKYQQVTIHGLKDYVIEGHVKQKGRRKDARQLTPETIEQTQWQSLRGALHVGHVGGPVTMRVRKTFSRAYSKGIVSSDGAVSPLVLSPTRDTGVIVPGDRPVTA